MKTCSALLFLSSCISLIAQGVTPKPLSPKPNIIVILADDMGYSDLGCFGSEIPTPNLDKLAANGMRLTQFYNMSRCCPSRAALMTGLYPHQAGVGNMTKDQGLPPYQGYLNQTSVTIAEVLKGAGYFTGMVGKWHIGGEEFATNKARPSDRGFDHSLAAVHGGFYWGSKVKDGKSGTWWLDGVNIPNDSPQLRPNWYSTDVISDYAIKYIDQAVAEKKPFFLYVAETAPHFPLSAPVEDVAKFRGKYMAGWNKLREQRYKKQIELGIIDPAWALSPLPRNLPKIEDIKNWDELTAEEKDRSDHIMALYAACVDHMDRGIGRIIDQLKKQNVLDNTLIIFLSDNGAEKGGGAYGKISDKKADEIQTGSAFQGQAWATLSNTPFGYYKALQHEGGISTSMIAHWPAGIKNAGAISRERGHIIDIMATCVDVAGATYPKTFNGNKITPMEGKSFAPVFSGGKIGHETLYWEHAGNRAILNGDWKMVEEGGGQVELYNLSTDRTEQHNLAAKNPEMVKQLTTMWETWAKRTGASPKPKEVGIKKKKGGKGGDEE